MDLTDEQWRLLEPLIPEPERRADGRGRPRRDARAVLDGILWVMRTGAPWKDLPPRYPPYQTCHRRFQEWVANDTFEVLLAELAKDLRDRGGIDISEGFIDGTFAGAKKGGFASGKPSAARGPRSWPLQTALVFLSPYMLQVRRRTR
jgi:transposase